MNLSRNGLIVLISVIFVAGAGTAYAGMVLPMITLAGDVTITGDMTCPGCVDSADIADGTITEFDLGTDSVGADEIKTASVGFIELATNAVRTGDILDETIQSRDIKDGTIVKADLHSSFFTTTFHSIDNTGGGLNHNRLVLTPSATSFCSLSSMGVKDVDGANERADCFVYIDSGNWEMSAFLVEPSNDADVFCTAHCFSWQ